MPERGLLGKGPGHCGYRGPAAHRKTGELTLPYIGSPDTGGVLLPGAPPATSAKGGTLGDHPSTSNEYEQLLQ